MANGKYYLSQYGRFCDEDNGFSPEGKKESNSIRNQRRLVEAYVRGRPEIILTEERVDDGFSGLDFDRPAFQQMIKEIKAGKTDGVIVKDLSRFGRNYIEVGRFVQKIFPYLGVRFIAVNDHYDSLEAHGGEDGILLSFKNLMKGIGCLRMGAFPLNIQEAGKAPVSGYSSRLPVFTGLPSGRCLLCLQKQCPG